MLAAASSSLCLLWLTGGRNMEHERIAGPMEKGVFRFFRVFRVFLRCIWEGEMKWGLHLAQFVLRRVPWSWGGELGLGTWQDWRSGACLEFRRLSWAAGKSRRRSEPVLGIDQHEAREA